MTDATDAIVIVAVLLFALILIVLFAGSPDLHDALIQRLRS